MSGRRRVKLITGVTVEDVDCYDVDCLEIRHLNPCTFSPCYASGEVLNTKVRSSIVPIKRWIESYYDPILTKCRQEGGYIALSPEIDETIGKYIKIICSEYEDRLSSVNHFLELSQSNLDQITNKITNATFLERLKFLFTRSISFE